MVGVLHCCVQGRHSCLMQGGKKQLEIDEFYKQNKAKELHSVTISLYNLK